MRTPENERVDPGADYRIEVTMKHFPGYLIKQPGLFDKRHQQGTGPAGHSYRGVQGLNCPLIRLALDSRSRSDDADVTNPSFFHRSAGSGSDHSHHRHLQNLLKLPDRQGRGGVTSNHDHFCIFSQEQPADFDTVSFDRRFALSAVREPGGIANIKDVFVRQQITQGANNSQPADARIEYSDRSKGWLTFLHLRAACKYL